MYKRYRVTYCAPIGQREYVNDRFDVIHQRYCQLRDIIMDAYRDEAYCSTKVTIFRTVDGTLTTIQQGYYDGKTKKWTEVQCASGVGTGAKDETMRNHRVAG